MDVYLAIGSILTPGNGRGIENLELKRNENFEAISVEEMEYNGFDHGISEFISKLFGGWTKLCVYVFITVYCHVYICDRQCSQIWHQLFCRGQIFLRCRLYVPNIMDEHTYKQKGLLTRQISLNV